MGATEKGGLTAIRQGSGCITSATMPCATRIRYTLRAVSGFPGNG